MATWQTSTTLQARPEQILDVLTDPQAAVRWETEIAENAKR